jgi:hypothetical protein
MKTETAILNDCDHDHFVRIISAIKEQGFYVPDGPRINTADVLWLPSEELNRVSYSNVESLAAHLAFSQGRVRVLSACDDFPYIMNRIRSLNRTLAA